MAETSASVDDYIADFPEDVQAVLQQIRSCVHRAVPDAQERISYQIPTITSDGQAIVYFAGWKAHVSLYPLPAGDDDLTAALAPYLSGKGTCKFPLNQPIPYALIERVARRLYEERLLQT